MKRALDDFFKPYGLDKGHMCKNCKHCFSVWGSDDAYCRKNGFISQKDFACINLYEEHSDGHVNYSSGYKNKEWRAQKDE